MKKKGPKSLGAKLDSAVRNGQEGQTKGVPVGPDTSLILSEIVLCAIDAELEKINPQYSSRSLRFMDDLEYSAQSRSEAEDVLLAWDGLLSSYHLALNPTKTRIVAGPVPPKTPWNAELAQFVFRESSDRVWLNDVHSFISRALVLAQEYEGQSVLSYAIQRIPIPTEHRRWAAFCDFLLMAAVAEPSSMRYVITALRRAHDAAVPIDRDRISQSLNEICIYHAPLEHGYEVSWSLSGLRRLGLNLDSSAASRIAQMKDNSSLILLQDLDACGRAGDGNLDMSVVIERAENELAPWSEDWLLGYEFSRNGWCSDAAYSGEPQWKELLDMDIGFYRSLADVSKSGDSTPGSGETDNDPEGDDEAKPGSPEVGYL